MEKITEKPVPVSQETTVAPSTSPNDTSSVPREAGKRFSSLLRKPAGGKNHLKGKTLQYVDKGLGSVQKRFDAALSAASQRSAGKAHTDEAHDKAHDKAYTDEAHDKAHTDEAHDKAHTDKAHTGEAHTDKAHTDKVHTDEAHTDKAHTDKARTDKAHTGEARTGEARTGEARTGEARTGEARTGEAHTGEARTGEARTGEAHTDKAHTGEAHTDEAHTDKVHTDKAHTDEAHTDEAHTDKARTDKARTGEAHTDKARTGEAHTDKARTGEARTDKAHTGEARTGEARTGEAHTDKAHTGEAHTDEAHTDEHQGESHKGRKSDATQAGLPDPTLGMGYIAHPASPASVEVSPAVSDAAAAPREIGEIAKRIAERILVTSPGSGRHPEVRIQLKSSVLDGSDVRIFREGGELKVVFVANGKDAEDFIVQNKGQLQQAIGDRLKDERIQISVELRQGGATESEHNEGRSRQQYITPDHELPDDSQDR